MTERKVTDQGQPRERLGRSMTLETIAVDMAYKRFLPFARLPERLHSSEIESYANRTSALTQADPEKAERDGILYVRTSDNRFRFPQNPLAGTDYTTNPA